MMLFPWKRALKKKTVWFSLVVIFTLGMVAALAPVISPYDPYREALTAEESYLPAMWNRNPIKPGQAAHPLGTDYYGRDVLSRLIYGARTAYFLALTAVPLTAVIGALAGLAAGYLGGRIDSGIMFIVDTVQSLPGIMFLVIVVMIFSSILEPTWINGMLTLLVGFAAVGWASLARLVRIDVMLVKEKLFVEAASGLGASSWYIISRHLFPNVLHVILVWIINNIPTVILLEALLGYIGVGVTGAVEGGEFNVVSWGGMFFAGRTAMNRNPVMLMIPSLCILLLSMSFLLLGDFLNEISRQEQG